MLFRFSLYGFLKNQRYFEPFLVLALLERGCDYTQIGILVAVREVAMQLLEIPSGALADAMGRRRVMVAAFAAYVASYLCLGWASDVVLLGVGMAGVGFADAFRSGTHKAMIFDWLRSQGRSEHKVEVYGYTRSWSKIGSVFAIPIAAAIAIVTGRYADAFLISAIPAALDAINLATYPRALDGSGASATARPSMVAILRRGLAQTWSNRPLRALLAEAVGFSGVYKAVKDYVQPLLVAAAASAWLLSDAGLDASDRTAVITGIVYMVLFGLGALASRQAHRWVARFETPTRAATGLWWAVVLTCAALAAGLWWSLPWLAIAAFVGLAPLHDLFRPTLVSRIDDVADSDLQATMLSLESQVTSLGTAGFAVMVGAAVDAASTGPSPALWPVGVAALALTLATALLRTFASSAAPPGARGTEPRPTFGG